MRCSPAAWLALAACAACTGCAGLPAPPVRVEAARAASAGLSRDSAPALRLRPGDAVDVTVDSVGGSATQRVVVEADGSLFVSGVGSAVAQGRSLADLERALTQKLQVIDRFGRIDVALREDAGQRVTVLGAVERQGAVQLVPGMRVADVIAAAGGPLSVESEVDGAAIALGDLSSAVVVRDGGPLPISLARALRGDPAHNVHAHPGDHVYVPLARDRSVRVMGQVRSPVVFAAPPGLRLSEALARAGGVTVGGDISDIRVVRGAVEQPDVYSADYAAVVGGEGPDMEVAPGDLVFVTDEPMEDIGEVLGLFVPLAAFASGLAFASLTLTL